MSGGVSEGKYSRKGDTDLVGLVAFLFSCFLFPERAGGVAVVVFR